MSRDLDVTVGFGFLVEDWENPDEVDLDAMPFSAGVELVFAGHLSGDWQQGVVLKRTHHWESWEALKLEISHITQDDMKILEEAAKMLGIKEPRYHWYAFPSYG